jgi:alkanesulfonate monooxygenase SsuD/methylene tetrahydromethanopterin reductase-like flavin-dependent oxidoreductase (luciferase family)
VPADQRPKLDLVVHPFDIDAPTFVRAVRRAEDAGFDAIWTYDHISAVSFRAQRSLDIWTSLAAIAMSTTTVEFGSLVVNTTVRLPAHIAVAAATLQDLSGGRFLLGLGAGAGPEQNFADEIRMVGITPLAAPTRRGIVADTIGFLRALWRGETSFESDQFSFTDPTAIAMPLPPPPIIVGANGPKMAALAGQHADMVNLHSWERDLAGLAAVARTRAAEVGNTNFALTVEGPHSDQWIDPDSSLRAGVAELGATRVMVQWSAANGFDAINRAARRLRL